MMKVRVIPSDIADVPAVDEGLPAKVTGLDAGRDGTDIDLTWTAAARAVFI